MNAEHKEEATGEPDGGTDDIKHDGENDMSSDIKNDADAATMADNDDQKSTRSDDDKDYFDNIDPEELVSPNFNSILKWCRGLC